MSLNRKLKILCLHGYRQDADIFKDKMGGFRKSIKNIADLTFVSAPLPIPSEETSHSVYGNNIMRDAPKEGRSWWFNSEDNTFNSRTKSECAIGFKESCNVIVDAFRSLGPFDGILGFSQGACMVSLICGLKERNEFPFDFHFVILVAGFQSLVESHQYLYEKPITVNNLHVIGKSDTCIPKEASSSLITKFEHPTVIYHEGGHFVPTQSETRIEYKKFLETVLNKIMHQSARSNV